MTIGDPETAEIVPKQISLEQRVLRLEEENRSLTAQLELSHRLYRHLWAWKERLRSQSATLSEDSGDVRTRRQKDVTDWIASVLGPERLFPRVLAFRLLEEAVKAFQTADGNAHHAHRLVDAVFLNSPGDFLRRIGGASLCLLALAEAVGIQADTAEANELERVLALAPEQRQEQSNTLTPLYSAKPCYVIFGPKNQQYPGQFFARRYDLLDSVSRPQVIAPPIVVGRSLEAVRSVLLEQMGPGFAQFDSDIDTYEGIGDMREWYVQRELLDGTSQTV